MADRDLKRQILGYRLTTAEIVYHMPDHPGLLQSFIWQQLDHAPDFPGLKQFLDFWRHNLDGALHSVRVGNSEVVQAAEMRHVGSEFRLN